MPYNPADPTKPGYVQFYLNNKPFGNPTTWTGVPPSVKGDPTGELPVNPASTLIQLLDPNFADKIPLWTMGVVDLHALQLILDTGSNTFMDVQWVKIWQK